MNKLYPFLCLLFFLSLTQGIKAQCTSSFTHDQNQCFGDSLLFTFNGTGASVEWNFGDVLSGPNNVDTNKVVYHQYTDTGFFTVRCIAITGGCRDTSTQVIYIGGKAQARFDYTDACLGLQAQFTNQSNLSYRDSILQIAWDFGDTAGSTQLNPSHAYTYSGNRVICQIISTRLGCKDTFKKTIKVIEQVTYSASKDSACLGSGVIFTSTSGSEVPLSYLWSFGDGNISSSPAPNYGYASSGQKNFVLTLTFSDSSQCKLNSKSVTALDLPDASFSYLTDTVQCFKGNSTCIRFNNLSQNIKSRNILWDDGSASQVSASDSFFCHQYKNPLGSSYQITLEVIDNFGCASRLKDVTNVVVLKDPLARFDFVSNGGCFKSVVSLTNLSNIQPPLVQKFKWMFGDGTVDSSNWLNPNHTYTSNGSFNITLQIRDTFGCGDTVVSNNTISNTSYPVDARIDTVYDYCRRNNLFGFRQTPVSGASITWNFGDGDSNSNFVTSKRYLGVGNFLPWVRISKNGCDSVVILDTATVYGPFASVNIQNQYQCQIKDTVYFRNTSIMFRNQNIQTLWRINDFVAANCTTDTKNGVNVNSNCNFSVDSLTFKHMFTPGNERCYSGFLVLKDTVVGCFDSVALALPLMRPVADSGLRVLFTNRICLGPEEPKQVYINLNLTQPGCTRESFYVMWDSLCAEESGNFDSHWRLNQDRHNYNYNNLPCDSNGYVTLGLIIQNGADSAGNVCRDTAFYHNAIRFGLLNPTMASSYDPDSLYCNYSTHDFFVQDSTQDSIVQIIWNFGDGTVDTVQSLGKVSHTFTSAGVYRVSNYIEHANGCNGIDTFQVRIGVNASFGLAADFVCLGDSVLLGNQGNYWLNTSTDYFRDNNRASQGKERTRWDLGDGNGFLASGADVYLKYNRIGDYNIRMEVRDSLGCLDTAQMADPFRVFDIQSRIQIPSDTLVCPQVVQLFSVSSVYDSINNFGHADDSVGVFIWTFDDGSGSSIQANPFKFFGRGKQGIKLYAENTRGCRDSVVDSFFIVSPLAHFVPITDSAGCQPHTVTLKNQGSNATTYTWFFRNAANNVFSTRNPVNMDLTYTNYGTYYPQLVATQNALNNGIPITCSDTFPVSANGDTLVGITVFENPIVRFVHTTDCSTNTTNFTSIVTINTDTIMNLWWTFGDGDSSTLANPVHQYTDTGAYRVVLHVRVGNGCEDSMVRTIMISPIPSADFNSANVCLDEQMQFTDTTNAFNDVIYLWNWNFGDGNTSGVQNPQHVYALDSTYRVSLRVTNRAGCFDTVSKWVTVHSKPVVDFGFVNACHHNTNIFAGAATVKDASLLSYNWDFGDGSGSSSKQTSHIYADTGDYLVKFTVTSFHGCKDSVIKVTRVHPNPESDFTINSPVQCRVGNNFVFTNTSTIAVDTINYSYWSASDGGSAVTQNYSKQFATFDSFQIQLISLTNNNCRDTQTKWVRVLESPVAQPVLSSSSHCINGDSISLVDTFLSVSALASRRWLLNGSLIGTDSFLKHKFNTLGANTLTLIKQLANGCTDTSISQISIHPKPTAYMKVTEDEQCFDTHAFDFSDSSWISTGSVFQRLWKLGNGDTSILSNFLYTYGLSDTFNVQLIAVSDNQCRDTVSRAVIVHPEPVANFAADTSDLCLRGNDFNFINQSNVPGTSLTYQWNFDGESTSVLTNPSYSFGTIGVKSVKLVARSVFGCLDSITRTIEVHPMPVSNPTVNSPNQCLNDQNYIFRDSSSIAYGNLKTLWIWNDVGTDTLKVVNRTFLKDTQYQHQLISISGWGCRDTSTLFHRVWPVPNTSFTINDTGQCINDQNYQFTNLSTSKDGIGASYWDYGDGNLDTLVNGSNYFGQPGLYTVSLITSSSQLCRDTHEVQLDVYHKPQAILNVNDSAQCFKWQNFDFTGGSNIPVGTLIGYAWDTSNAPFLGSKDMKLNFPKAGSYSVKYVVESNEGCFDTTSQDIVVHPDPISGFTVVNPLQCENDNLFEFSSISSITAGTIVDSWYAGQSYWSSLGNPTRMFTSQDTVSISLVNTSDKGCKDTARRIIFVVPAPHTQFTINDSGQCLLANQFDFTNTSWIEDGVLTYEWDFGNGNTSLLTDPTHNYTDHGNYTVQLIGTSVYNCKDTQRVEVLVHPEPTAAFTVNDPSQCLNENSFINTNTSTVDSTQMTYTWHFGDGNTSVLTDPTYSYLGHGAYNNKLVVSTNYGCLDSSERIYTVSPMPISQFTINDSTQCINTQNFEFTNTSTIATGTISSFEWRSNGVIATNINPWTNSYNNSRPYGVLLQTISDSGCTDSAFKVIRVHPKPISGISVNDSVQCLTGNYYLFKDESFDSFGVIGYSWLENNTQVSTADTLGRVYLSEGMKKVNLISTSSNQCQDTTELWVRVKPMPDPTFAPMKPFYCEDQPAVNLIPNQSGGTFFGKNILNQQYVPRILWNDVVTYVIEQEGCIDSSKQFTKVYPLPNADLGNDTTICKHESLLLGPTSWASTYVWNNGSTDSTLRLTRVGQYWVTATNVCGSDSDTINVRVRDINCRFFLPTAFTPNANSINDRYRPVTYNVDEMTFEIFNRWGGKIYEGDVNDPGWDGTFEGEKSPEGWYLIVVKYSYQTELRKITESAYEVFYLLR